MKTILKQAALVAAVAAVAAVAPATALAGTAIVNPYGCFAYGGGSATVPAGSTVTIRQGWSDQELGMMRAFLGAQTTTLSVNGGPSIDLTDAWTAPAQQSDGSWLTRAAYDTGITLGSGQSLTFTFEIVLRHPINELVNGSVVKGPAGSMGLWTCTVTGA